MTPITNYDPNIRWARHTFSLTFMQWDYSLTVQVEVTGNCRGAGMFDGAILTYFDELYDQDDGTAGIVLKKGDDTLEVDLEDEDDLRDLCVGIVIVGHKAEI